MSGGYVLHSFSTDQTTHKVDHSLTQSYNMLYTNSINTENHVAEESMNTVRTEQSFLITHAAISGV